MGAYIVNPDLVQGRKQRSNEYRKSISEMDLDSLMFFERSKVMQLMAFLYERPRTKMEIYHDGNFYRNGAVIDKLDELVQLGYVKYSDKGKSTLATLTKTGYEIAGLIVKILEARKKDI